MTVQDTELAQDAKVLKPLVVDLDHSLVRTDTLVESVLALMTKQPRAFLRALAQLRFGTTPTLATTVMVTSSPEPDPCGPSRAAEE